MSTPAIEDAAARLRLAYRDGVVPPLASWFAEADADVAYQIQETNTAHWLAAGRRLVGRKIGLTSTAVQQQLGVNEPDFGMLFADMEVASDGDVALSRLLQPRVEAEIAFVLDRDLLQEDLTVSDAMRATAYVLPAIEIVDSRIRDWKITLADTIADNASSGMYVIGSQPRALCDVDLRLCGMALTRNRTIVSTGSGAACLGHPLNAVKWLAQTLLRKGRPLRAGDVVLSGALGPMTSVNAGDTIVAEIGGLGSVQVRFT